MIKYKDHDKYRRLICRLIQENPMDSTLAGFYLKTRYDTFDPKEFIDVVKPHMERGRTAIPALILSGDMHNAADMLDIELIWREVLTECGQDEETNIS